MAFLTVSCIYVASFCSVFLDCALLPQAPGYNQCYHLSMAGVGLCDAIKQSLFLLLFHLSGFPPSLLRNQDILSTQGQMVPLHESTGFLRLGGRKQQKKARRENEIYQKQAFSIFQFACRGSCFQLLCLSLGLFLFLFHTEEGAFMTL